MFALHSRRLRRRLSAPSSGSARRRARERRAAERTRLEGERLARLRLEQRLRDKIEQQRQLANTLGRDVSHRVGVPKRLTDIATAKEEAITSFFMNEALPFYEKLTFCQNKIRQLREELASYEPWGRAGAGAPNPRGVRFSDLRSTGIYPEDELRGVAAHEPCHRWSSPRRARRCTPIRLREDPQLCYAEALRRTVDNDIRYKQTPRQQQMYKQILDDMVNKRKKAIKDEIKRDLEYERKMLIMDGPWGKPGPGGTTWRNPRDIGLNFSKSMGWTDNELFDKLKGEHRRYKRSSITLPRVKIDDDSKKEYFDKENIKSANEKLPQISYANTSAETRGKHDTTKRNEVQNISVKGSNSKSKRCPKKSNFIKRLSNGDRVPRLVLEEEANTVEYNDIREKKLTPEETILRLTGGIELVPLLARRRRVGARTLPSSDVTRPPEQACQWRELLDADHLRQLKHQIRVKCEQHEESRRDSAESVRRHHATWASLWGRPGHGAPQRGRYARNNLARLLYVAPLSSTPL